jgi:F0F1-type ATP synthase delta subunit
MGCKEEKKCDISKIKVDDIKVVTPASLSDEEKGKLKKAVTKWFIENKSILGNF